MSLNPQHQRFVDEYFVDFNATQAAIRAGYAEHTAKQQGSRLLTRVDVSTAIEQRRAEHAERLIITAEDIAREAWKIATTARSETARVSALALLAKRHPEFSEKHEISGDVRHRIEALQVVAQMTPEQLRAISGGARDGGD